MKAMKVKREQRKGNDRETKGSSKQLKQNERETNRRRNQWNGNESNGEETKAAVKGKRKGDWRETKGRRRQIEENQSKGNQSSQKGDESNKLETKDDNTRQYFCWFWVVISVSVKAALNHANGSLNRANCHWITPIVHSSGWYLQPKARPEFWVYSPSFSVVHDLDNQCHLSFCSFDSLVFLKLY
jgi:hypothetical protein